MARTKIANNIGAEALRVCLGEDYSDNDLAVAVRWLAQLFESKFSGRSVEIRVLPFVAFQCIEGIVHTRGTPPNVVELDSYTWILLCTGKITWQDALSKGLLTASGIQSDLSAKFPIV